MKVEDRNQLITNAAAKMHEAWCEGELRAFYSRFTAEVEKGAGNGTALYNACYTNGKQRNALELDTTWLQFHEVTATEDLKTFEGFMDLFNKGIIEVKRFTERTLTEEEQKKAGAGNYNAATKTENILRTFDKLSADSQDKAKYAVAKEEGLMEIYPDAQEEAALDAKIPEMWRRNCFNILIKKGDQFTFF